MWGYWELHPVPQTSAKKGSFMLILLLIACVYMQFHKSYGWLTAKWYHYYCYFRQNSFYMRSSISGKFRFTRLSSMYEKCPHMYFALFVSWWEQGGRGGKLRGSCGWSSSLDSWSNSHYWPLLFHLLKQFQYLKLGRYKNFHTSY